MIQWWRKAALERTPAGTFTLYMIVEYVGFQYDSVTCSFLFKSSAFPCAVSANERKSTPTLVNKAKSDGKGQNTRPFFHLLEIPYQLPFTNHHQTATKGALPAR
eukprot:scaffold1230_cov166-Amphora_coffeaeformis.AAC.3